MPILFIKKLYFGAENRDDKNTAVLSKKQDLE